MDVNAQRLSFCKNNLGIQYTINPATEDAVAQLAAITIGDMPTVVMEATGNQHAINNGFAYMAHGGRYVLVGLQKEAICFSHPEFHKREGTLMSSRNATRQDFEWVMNAMKTGRLNPTTFITHTVPFGQAKEAFPNWLDPAHGTIKAQINMEA
jgi:threonine dehydrogenase-like Zn-dependent dehydrogenase